MLALPSLVCSPLFMEIQDQPSQRIPQARRDGIFEEPLGEKIILFDSATRQSLTLSSLESFVWSRCDGETSVAEISKAFARENPDRQNDHDVLGALDQLAEKSLLLGNEWTPVVAAETKSRRTFLNYGALAAKVAIAFPLLGSFLNPTEAQAFRTPRSVNNPFPARKKKKKNQQRRRRNQGNRQNNGGGNTDPPAPVDCYGGWGDWGPCDFYMQAREYTVIVPAANGGLACEVEDGTIETQDCGAPPVDCAGTWSAWSSCSVSCGSGTQARVFNITTPAANGGAACPVSPESQSCEAPPCAVVCQNCFEASDRCQPDGSCIHLCPNGGTGDCCTSQDGGATYFDDC